MVVGKIVDNTWINPEALVAQQVKNLPAMQEMLETQVRSLGWEGPPGEEMATHSSMLAWRIPGQRRLAGYGP